MQLYSWEQLAKQNKQTLAKKQPILILGARDISQERIQDLTQQLLAKRAVVWGCLSDKFIPGLEGSPQFKSLKLKKLKTALADLSADGADKSISILSYPQQYAQYLIKEIDWSAVIGIHGSWHKAFHYRPEYYQINKKGLSYKLVGSFVDESEAKDYYQHIKTKLPQLKVKKTKNYSDEELLELADQEAKKSFDYTFQTGVVLAENGRFLAAAHNKVVPYETYMLHQGASKEINLAPPHDLNHFDTNHAEVELILKAASEDINLKGTSLYINLLPCPICARMLARTPIKEVVYQYDHSEGYGFKLLEEAGKKLRRVAI